MNQQRSRRFRTAKEAKELRDKAIRKGEDLPKEAAFDSNAITPGTSPCSNCPERISSRSGTPFMARLSEQLKWFVNKKVTEDANWRGVEVVLSGHEVRAQRSLQ
jgi:5'-3' exoribonuclease 1